MGARVASGMVGAIAAIAFAQDPNAGLTAHWRFDDRSGAIAIDSAHPGKYVKNINTDQYYPDYGQYPGTIYNAKWIGGQIVGALGFDGHARVITPAIPVSPTFTVSAWVQPDPTMTYAYPRIIESQYDTGFYLGLDMTASMYKFIGTGGAGSTGTCGQPYGCVEGGAVKGNAWQLVTATYDGTMARLYVDGVQVASDTAAIQPRSLPVYIGDYYGLPDYYGWRGGIDDVRIYGRALSPSEVLTLYNQASNVRLPPVVISGMKCKESSFLGKDTRTMTCAMTSQNTAWRGSLQVKLEHADPNIIQPPLNYSWPVLMQRDGKYAVTGVAVYDKPGTKPRVMGADFYGDRAAAEWYSHTEPRTVLVQSLDSPCPSQSPCASGLYPPPLVVTEMRCEAAAMDASTQSVTCGIAANQNVYGGTLRITYNDGTNEDQAVTVEQPTIDGALTYWGVVAVAANSSQPIDQVSFGAESPIANWTPETTTPYPPVKSTQSVHGWLCKVFGWFCGPK
jgi:Concanavalin A-like lectin/glucanases superfamily